MSMQLDDTGAVSRAWDNGVLAFFSQDHPSAQQYTALQVL